MPEPKEGDLRVWWIPQIPMEYFTVPVETLREARLLLNALGEYDLFQLEHNVKPDYSNVGGLHVFEDGEWCSWYDDQGRDFDAIPMDELTHNPLQSVEMRQEYSRA